MNVKMKPPKRRRPTAKSSKELKRTNTKFFSLCDKKVCQSFFLKTLSISNGPLNNAFKHKSDFANFFEGSDQRGRHIPSNKLKQDVVDSIVNFLDEKCITETNGKFRKKIICDVDYRSLRTLFNAYKEFNGGDVPSYTSFKKIFYDNNFSFPHERQKPMKQEKNSSGNQCQILEIVKLENANLNDLEEVDNNDLKTEEIPSSSTAVDNPSTPRIIVTQIPDSTAYQQPTQVYEIQFVCGS